MTEFLSREDFAQIIRTAPLVSIDLIIRDPQDCVLVGRRNNAPARGTYFVPGGVIRKNERLARAFARILAGETGLAGDIASAQLLGAYEHIYPDNRFGDPAYGTHYVVLAHEIRVDPRPDIRRDDQHNEMRWMSVPELLTAPDVHENTKAYFR